MKFRNIIFTTLVAFIFVQLLIIVFLIREIEDEKSVTDFLSYDKENKLVTVRNEDDEDLVRVWFNKDNTLFQCYVNDKEGVDLSVIFDDSMRTISLQDLTIPIQSIQYINLTDEIIIDRQESFNTFLRHSQTFKDGTIQQRKWDYDKQRWEIELPSNGKWKSFPPFSE